MKAYIAVCPKSLVPVFIATVFKTDKTSWTYSIVLQIFSYLFIYSFTTNQAVKGIWLSVFLWLPASLFYLPTYLSINFFIIYISVPLSVSLFLSLLLTPSSFCYFFSLLSKNFNDKYQSFFLCLCLLSLRLSPFIPFLFRSLNIIIYLLYFSDVCPRMSMTNISLSLSICLSPLCVSLSPFLFPLSL